MDEHRLGLKPALKRVWAPEGRRPVAKVHHRYEWWYVYCFVRPSTGETCRLLMPEVGSEAFSLALAHFARQAGAGPAKRILLALDGAGYRTGGSVRVPERVGLERPPACSPELQPPPAAADTRRLWPLTNEGVANELFASLGELEDALAKRVVALADQPGLIRSTTLYHWWPRAA